MHYATAVAVTFLYKSWYHDMYHAAELLSTPQSICFWQSPISNYYLAFRSSIQYELYRCAVLHDVGVQLQTAMMCFLQRQAAPLGHICIGLTSPVSGAFMMQIS